MNTKVMTETLGKAELIYILKKKETREMEYLMVSSLVDSLLKRPSDKRLREIIQRKIDQKIKDAKVEDPPAYFSCPISFVRPVQRKLIPGPISEPSYHLGRLDLRERAPAIPFQTERPLRPNDKKKYRGQSFVCQQQHQGPL